MSLKREILDQLGKLPSVIKSRGESIYNAGWMEATYYEVSGEQFEFEVKGKVESFYHVKLNFSPTKHSCECVYYHNEGECKHIAACLHYLVVSHGAEEYERAASKKAIQQPIQVVPTEDAIDPKALLEPLITTTRKEDYDYTVSLHADELRVMLSSKWKFVNEQDVSVGVKWHDGAYWLACSNKSCHNNCDHIQWLIAYILRFRTRNLLLDLRAEAYHQRNENFLFQSGLSLREGEQIQDLLDTFVIGEDVRFFPKGRLKGVTQVGHMVRHLHEDVLGGIRDIRQKEALLVGGRREENAERRVPAFVWVLNQNEQSLQRVIAVKGKPNKANTKLSSHLEVLKSPGDLSLESGAGIKEGFYQAEKINSIAVLDKQRQQLSEMFHLVNGFFEATPHVFHYVYSVDSAMFGSVENFRLSELQPLNHLEQEVKLKFRFFQEEDLFTLKSYLETANRGLIEVSSDMELFDQMLVRYMGTDLYLINSMKEAQALSGLLQSGVFRTTRQGLSDFIEQVLQPVAEQFPVEIEDGIPYIAYKDIKPMEQRLYLSELNQFVMLRPAVLYEGGREVNVMEDHEVTTHDGQDLVVFERNKEYEDELVQKVAALHPAFHINTQQSFFHLSHKELVKGHWFLHAFDQLKDMGVRVFGLNDLKNLKFSPHRAKVNVSFKSNQDWFETAIDVAFGNTKVKLNDVRKAIERNSSYVELSDGTLGILPEEWLQKFGKIFRTAAVDKGTVKISKTNFNAVDDLVTEDEHPEIFEEIKEKKARLESFSEIEQVQQPKTLRAELRDYQQSGLNWLNFLREYGWGGILADDMGLGKTLQALALICLELEQNPDKPNLVIAPTTLLFNWKAEIEKFAPGLDYFIHHGQRYDSVDDFRNHQVVLTSYGIAVNDIALLNKIDFNLIIADESQAIKNLNSKRHKALIKLNGRVRIAMSGTPIENNVYELYAQMRFVNPGFFQGISTFKEHYAAAIERDNNPDLISELRKKIKPFILRRTKEQVLTELPDKTEEYLYCEMSAGQRKVYDAFRNEYRDYLMEKFDEEGLEKSQMYVLEGLTRLRQICDSPQLIQREGLTETSSAKLDELLSHVMEKTGKHKILVFSQFVKMLKLVEQKFVENKISYEYLDGQTNVKSREQKVRRFQEDDDCRVFLISLKAGGTGLNLTSADYVYILDPWWNPAVENQAIDRCYRMGQKKSVFAYRMICKGTVEEKIIALQDRKRELSNDIVGTGDGMMKKLSQEDIEELFS
ncbi:DEAD/DEAH box helicase [Marinoscillum furvescens]|uniref:SNF2 family DNA or RNA helicase n=1 Tax=Marinoscillum furvescens DSM 4134 TaxID=1122208 RepID=A0A3D9L0F8_MARFU|nr:DEAD/DEAH box helicase [Marinoscillum furvescens]RED94346.1 SNF2 family DNA or RNA helicase [Marinoscillum furvescens DSM 4134]